MEEKHELSGKLETLRCHINVILKEFDNDEVNWVTVNLYLEQLHESTDNLPEEIPIHNWEEHKKVVDVARGYDTEGDVDDDPVDPITKLRKEVSTNTRELNSLMMTVSELCKRVGLLEK